MEVLRFYVIKIAMTQILITQYSMCYTVDGAIGKIIQDAAINGKYVDVYLESPIKPKIIEKFSIDMFLRLTYAQGPLNQTIKRFYNCLYDRQDCKYPNARFHYIDIRGALQHQGTNISAFKFITQYMNQYIESIHY